MVLEASRATTTARLGPMDRDWSWSAVGWLAGLLGAAVVALFFLGLDLMAGRPLWTPTALGSALFLGEPVAADAPPVLALVAGYTAVHLGVFAGFGLIAAALLSVRHRASGAARVFGIAALLFAAFDLAFWALSELCAPTLLADLGVWRVASANVAAATCMAVFLGAMAAHLRPDAVE